MTFADLVASDMNFRHPDRVKQGKPARPQDMPDWAISICNVLDKIRVYPPGAHAAYCPEPEELETVDLEELGIVR